MRKGFLKVSILKPSQGPFGLCGGLKPNFRFPSITTMHKEANVMEKIFFKNGLALVSLALLFMAMPLLAGEAGAQQADLQRIANASSMAELQNIYSGSDNTIIRSEALQAIPGVMRKSGVSREGEQVYQLLNLGLQDRSVTVVKEAIRQVGDLRLESFSPALVDVFYGVDTRFPGSQQEVQVQVIGAFGKMGGNDARMLFRDLLGEGIVSYRTNKVLEAIQQTHDSFLAASVTAYAAKVESILQSMQDTPQNHGKYVMVKMALELARRVEKSLLE